MNLVAFDRFCATLPATAMVVQWEGAHVWKVGGKVFAIGTVRARDDEEEPSFAVSLKCSEIAREMLAGRAGVGPAPHLPRGGWLQIRPGEDGDAVGGGEMRDLARGSHALMVKALTKAKRRELGLDVA